MPKYTGEQIKKIVECCVKSTHFGECFDNKCPMVSEEGCAVGKETLFPYALDLINRQEAEIERLQREIANCNSEIERLNKEVERNYRIRDKACAMLEAEEKKLPMYFANAKSEAIKEYIELLKAEILKDTVGNDSFAYFIFGYIDKVKKMVGESK